MQASLLHWNCPNRHAYRLSVPGATTVLSSSGDLFQQGWQNHQAGRLREAEELYREVVRNDPQHADAWCFLGAVYQALGRSEEAEAYSRRAVDISPNHPSASNLLGVLLAQRGRLEEAAASFEKSLSAYPQDPEGWHNRGLVRLMQGRHDEAVADFERALQVQPEFALARASLDKALYERAQLAGTSAKPSTQLPGCNAAVNLGQIRLMQGQVHEAVGLFRQALQTEPRSQDALQGLGQAGDALADHGDFDGAASCYREILRHEPEYAEAHNSLGRTLASQGRSEDAIDSYREAIRLRPNYVIAYINLGAALNALEHFDDAVKTCKQALVLRPDSPHAYINLGNALAGQGKFDEAISSFQQALRLKPDSPDAYFNLANTLVDKGCSEIPATSAACPVPALDDAMAAYEQALQLAPDRVDTRYNRAALLLLRGDYERGWPEYEWRFRLPRYALRHFPQPRWDGSLLAGGCILLHAEQGLGDNIQFLRYAPLVKERCGAVFLQCQEALVPLASTCSGIDLVQSQEAEPPAFDVHCPLTSLPGIFGTTLSTIPNTIPYLKADPKRVNYWRDELAEERRWKVGMVWQGSGKYVADRQRSVPLAEFAPLAKVPGIVLYSLQVGPGVEQLASAGFQSVDLGSRTSLADLGAVLLNLDLLITVDTAPAHLAGALGVPFWLALPRRPDWRWMLARHDSPWYPTARLFRQREAGKWGFVFEQMADALA